MALNDQQGPEGKETLSASEVRLRLKKNYEALSAVMESGYLPYLKPHTIARIEIIVRRK